MKYTDKVKASKGIVEAIKALKDGEYIKVQYGTDRSGKPNTYKIKCSIWQHSGPSYSIHKDDIFAIDGMNIDTVALTTMRAYTYDMMSQRTTYTFPLYKMTIIK
jgi:hypothetical protein